MKENVGIQLLYIEKLINIGSRKDSYIFSKRTVTWRFIITHKRLVECNEATVVLGQLLL